MINGYVNYRTILARLYRELDTNTEINESDVIEWISDALLMIGVYGQYEHISTTINTDSNGNANLPKGFLSITYLSYNNIPLDFASVENKNQYCSDNCTLGICGNPYNFYIKDCHLYSNLKSSCLKIEYTSIMVDDEGYPLVPDDIYYLKALVAYVISKLDYREWRKGNISDKVYQKSESDWLFYVNSARASGNMPNLIKLQSIKNMWQRLIPKPMEYYNKFNNIRNPEHRRNH